MTPQQIKHLRLKLGIKSGLEKPISTAALGEMVGRSGRTIEDLEQGRYPATGAVLILLQNLNKETKDMP